MSRIERKYENYKIYNSLIWSYKHYEMKTANLRRLQIVRNLRIFAIFVKFAGFVKTCLTSCLSFFIPLQIFEIFVIFADFGNIVIFVVACNPGHKWTRDKFYVINKTSLVRVVYIMPLVQWQNVFNKSNPILNSCQLYTFHLW